MATRQELEQKLKDLQDSLDAVPPEFKDDIKKEIDKTQNELSSLPAGTSAPAQPQDSGMVSAALSTLRAAMLSGEGSGVDSKEVRELIEEYLKTKKINLSELDAEVLEEIKKNQKVILEIPQFGDFKIEISKADANIPYFFEVLDDVVAGNNVYLIGEAGGGKTYTAEEVAKRLKREWLVINCSQYTSPTEILGGQTIEGYKQGKLIDAWKNGKILILDEMPRLDPNTAGLFNDALAKSSKTREAKNALINSTNPEEPPVERNDKFALIATGNIYPNTAPPPKYKANNQQDLSLLDRFSGSVYKVEYTKPIDELNTRFKFLYEMLVGNYYEYMDAIKNNKAKPEPRGLRTVLKDLEEDNLAVVSYRTLISFRVAFEFELVRALAKSEGKDVGMRKGKTLQKALDSFMVAFQSDTVKTIIQKTKFTPAYVESKVNEAIKEILNGNMTETLNDSVAKMANSIFKRYEDFFAPETVEP
jgi:hypothetical protein